MGPIRKSRSAYKKISPTNEVSPSKDGDSAKKGSTRKRKKADMLGPRWTTEELTLFYEAYRKHGKEWKKVAGSMRNRSSEMVETLYTMNRAYLSLPHGMASEAGLIAMMTDHYTNLARSDSDQESNDGAGSSRKTQKRARVKARHPSSKALGEQASSYDFLSLLKKKRSGVEFDSGSKPFPVGKRTPRFPVSFSHENIKNGEKYVSPTRQVLKTKVTANDDEVMHEVAKVLAEARTPSKRTESVMSPPFRHSQRKHAEVDDLPEGSTEADDNESHLDDIIKEESSGTEEGERLNEMRGKSPLQCQRMKSKKSLFGRDEDPAFDALETLAALSLMMPIGNEQEIKDGDADHVDESLPLQANQPKEKRRSAGIPARYENSSIKTSKSGKASILDDVEPNQDHRITKSSRRKQKSQVSKESEARPDSHPCKSPGLEDGEMGKKMMTKSKKLSKNISPKLLRVPENSSSSDLPKEGSDSVQSAAQAPVVNQVTLPTKVRSRRKMNPKKLEVQNQKDLKYPDKMSSDQSNLLFASLSDKLISSKEKLSTCLSHPLLRRWCTYEWFYSAIDYPWFAKREFVEYLYHVGLGHVPRLTRVEWGVIRSSLGKPRRFSVQFLKEEKEKLNQYRDSVRKHYTELRDGVREGLPTDLARPLSVGQRVIAIHPKTREIHDGSVLTVDHSRCRVQFDRHELGVEFVKDIDCMPLNPYDNMPALFGRRSVAFDRCFEKFNEVKVNGLAKEFVKLSSGDNNLDNLDGLCQPSPVTNAASLRQTKVASSNPNVHSRTRPIDSATFQQTSSHSQTKEADVQALAELTRALDKKEALVLELRRMNDDVSASENEKDGGSSLKDSDSFKKQYAAVLVKLHETNDQVQSAIQCLRDRNTYQGNGKLMTSNRPAFGLPITCETQESRSHVNEIMDTSRSRAQTMVNAAMQAVSSLKIKEDTFEKIEEVVDYVNDLLPSHESVTPVAADQKVINASHIEAQIPSELISKCVATLLMIQKCTERQFPPSDVAQILDSAVTSLQPLSTENVGLYTEIQKCMGIIRNQILALIPT